MNKLVKGSIAGAAGIALLLGGAGTFALWNSTASISSQTITAGQLSLTANGNGVWKDGTTTIDPLNYRIIPGKTLVYTQSLAVNAVGDGIKADLTYSGLTATGTNSLDTLITKTLEVTSPTATVAGSTLKFAAGASTVNVKITVVFPDTVTGNAGQNGTLNLNGITFTLTQTP